ncbi:type II toxin-antitoxin system RelE family toxin [Rickettsiella endosymbiont of Aleochara curtula]|uniref:type II toxin-antitoxin system RelE family toxin n=1 Tax=Rickettsiella endosymbiont of Aleochara curtula TaxID=3077936 RepID=UPI00313A7B40
MIKISFAKQALKFLKQVPIKHGRQLAMTVESLKENPFPQDAKKLKGISDYHRVDVGEYRVIYRIDAARKLLIIAFMGKRNDNEVYKKFKRKKVNLSNA